LFFEHFSSTVALFFFKPSLSCDFVAGWVSIKEEDLDGGVSHFSFAVQTCKRKSRFIITMKAFVSGNFLNNYNG